MSKTTPVRWWRDDATRYAPRAAVRPTNSTAMGGWAWHLAIRDTEPEIAAVVDACKDVILDAKWVVPMRSWNSWGDLAAPDPIRDIRAATDSLEHEMACLCGCGRTWSLTTSRAPR